MCGPHGLAGSQNMLFRGNGDGTFSDVSEKAGLLAARPAFGFTPLVLDYDNDRWPDVYVANHSAVSLMFHNNHDGKFKDVGMQTGDVVARPVRRVSALSGSGVQLSISRLGYRVSRRRSR